MIYHCITHDPVANPQYRTAAGLLTPSVRVPFVVHQSLLLRYYMEQNYGQPGRRSLEDSSRIILESISEGFLAMDANWIVTYANAAAERVVAMSRYEMVGQYFWTLFADGLDDVSETNYRLTATARTPRHFEKFSHHFKRWFEVNSYPTDDGGIVIYFRDTSARREWAQAERRANEAREAANANAKFRAFFDQGPQYGWLTDLDGTVVEANKCSLAACGLERAAVVGQKLWDCQQWRESPALVTVLQHATLLAAKGQDFKQELNYFPASGEEQVVEWSVAPVLDDDGNIIFIAHTGIDVSVRYRLDAALADAKTRLESMLAAAEVATWTWDIKTNLVSADRNLAQLFSMPKEKENGAPITDYFAALHPDDVVEVQGLIGAALASGEPFEARYRVKAGENNYRTVIARGQAQYASDGTPIALPGVVVDITRQALAERELNASNKRYSTLIELMDEGFCLIEVLLDHQGEPYDYLFVEVNQSFEHQTGLVDVVGKTARTLLPNLEMDWVDTYGRVALTGESMRFEMQSDAMGRAFDVYASRLGDANSRMVSLIFADITARKNEEDALRSRADNLLASDRRKTEFLATLAHELRNPLAPLRNGLQLLKLAANKPETIARVYDMMERQLSQMVHLVDDLLDIARISSGKIELKKEHVRLSSIIANAVETSLPLIESCRHQLTVNVQNEAILLHVDAIRLAQVLSNLLNNAAKYTPSEGRIELNCHDDGRDVFIAVKDTGVGLSPESISHVFEMFSQVGRSSTQSQGGLGIGLSLVQQIVQLHDGSVSAHSEGVGLGSTFILQLPLAIPHQVDHGLSVLTPAQPAHPHELRILVVDDNVDAAESLAALLSLIGHTTLVAINGEDAIAKAQVFMPQIAFLDIGLPGMDGCQLARILRRMPTLAQLHLVALTGWGGKEDRAKTADAGFDEHLLKPTDFATVEAVIARFQA